MATDHNNMIDIEPVLKITGMVPINTTRPDAASTGTISATTTTANTTGSRIVMKDDIINPRSSTSPIPKPILISVFTMSNPDQMKALRNQLGGVFAWTKEDDERLSEIMTKFKAANKYIWDDVSAQLQFGNHKPPKECFQRWTWYLSPPRKNLSKKRFTVDEDAIIFYEVTKSQGQRLSISTKSSPASGSSAITSTSISTGKPSWTNICKLISCSEPHRVRERFHNILNPNINHMPFSKKEDVRLYEGLKEYGQKWTLISKEFFTSTRSDIQLKNRFKTKSFQQFYAKVVTRTMEQARRKKQGLIQMNASTTVFPKINISEVDGASFGLGDGGDQANSDVQGVLRNTEAATVKESDDANNGGDNEMIDDPTLTSGELNENGMETEKPQSQQMQLQKASNPNLPAQETAQTSAGGTLSKRLKTSLAALILNEDVPKPPPGKYFTPLGAAQILTMIGTSERRTVMKIWIERGYVPVNLTSLYRALGRYRNGLKLKPRWYCEGRLGVDRVGGSFAEGPNTIIMNQYSASINTDMEDLITKASDIPNPAVKEYIVGTLSDADHCRIDM